MMAHRSIVLSLSLWRREATQLAREQVALGTQSIANVNFQMRVNISWEAYRWHMLEKTRAAHSSSSRSDQLNTLMGGTQFLAV
jgi:hypothetical protein